VSGSFDGTVKEWSPGDNRPKGTFVASDVADPANLRIHSLLFDGVNNIAAGRSDGKLTFWDYHKETPYLSIKAAADGGAVLAIDWLGDVIVSSGTDKIVHVWSLRENGSDRM